MKRVYVKAAISVVDMEPVLMSAASRIRVDGEEYEIEDEEDILVKRSFFEDYLFRMKE